MADEDKQLAAEEQRRRQRQMNERQSGENPYLRFLGESIGTALAWKTGKMLARRTGLASVAERGLNFGATFARRLTTNSSFSKAVEDWTIDDVRGLRKTAETAYKEASEAARGKVHLNPEESRSLFSHLRQIRTMRNTGGISDADNAWTQRLINHATENLEAGVQASRMDANEAQRFRSFISNVASGVHKENIVNEQIKRAGFTGAQKDFAQMLVNDMKAYSKEHRTPFMLDWRRQNKFLMKEMASLDEMEEIFGTATRKKGAFGKLVDLIQGQNEVTVRDLLKNKDKIEVSTYKTGGAHHAAKKFDPIQDMEDMRKFYARIDAQKGTNFEERFLNITADVGGLGKDANGNIYSKEGSRKFVDSLIKGVADTLPGKVLKARDFEYARFAPKFSLEFKGSYDPVLAALTNNKENHGSSQLDSTIFHTSSRYFRFTENGLEEIEELRGIRTHMASGEYGARKNILKQMAGDVRYKRSDNRFLRFFDIGQDRDEFSGMNTPLERIKAMANKYDSEDYFGNIIDSYTDATNGELNTLHDTIDAFGGSYQRETAEQRETRLGELFKVKTIRDFMHDNTYGVTRESAGKLAVAAENKDAKRIFEALQSANHEELIDFVKNADFDYISDSELKDVSNRLQTNPRSVLEIVKQKESRSNTRVGSSINDIVGTDTGNSTETVDDYLRTILTREAFAKESASRVPDTDLPDFQQALDLIKKADLSGVEETNAKRSAMTSYFDDMVNLSRDIGEDDGSNSIGEGWQAVERAHNIFVGDDELTSTLRGEVRNMRKEKSHFTDTVYENPDEIGNPIGYNPWVTMRDATGPLDILNDLNSWTKTKANAKQFFKQFYAGRDSMESVSEYTQIPYFLLSRLSDEMNKVGLGFSKDNMSSTADLASAIMLKRVIPIGVAATYYEWADDTSQEVTGMSITGAAAQGVANVDIASRKLMDTFGITDWMKSEKSINPIMQYWGDHNEFQSADERRKWYESGYTPVRKGAWWTFGGVNEARGGAIQYFEPTFVRRIQSDYEDKSLYDGYFDKWSHSLLPTPTNPFSPILGILDPYWLEEKHKDDRPYELTGHMFADGTPWGAVLNPTIGELIKPQKSLHTIPFTDIDYRNVNGIDPLSLLHSINEYTKQKARDLAGENYIQIGGSNFDPINFVPYDHPTDDTNVLSVQFRNGQLLGTRYGTGGPNIGATGAPNDDNGSSSGLSGGTGSGGTIGGISLTGGKSAADALETVNQNNHIGWKEAIDYAVFGGPAPNQQNYVVQKTNGKDSYVADKDGQPVNENARHLYDADRLEINRLTKGDFLGIKEDLENIMRDHNPANWLRQMNDATKAKAGKNIRTMSQDEIDAEEGMAQGLKLKNYRPVDAMNLLNDPDTVTDLINQGKGSSFVQNAAVSWRLISGIYGYGVGEATGFGVDNKKRIATGQDMTSFSRNFWDENLGGLGGPAAEIMRRFIPDYRRNARINPLMNEMPDWLPDRFRYGDPYCVSADTLIESGKLQFNEAKDVLVGCRIITHKGNEKEVSAMAIREVRSDEKVYKLKIASVSAVESKFSEDHPIMVVKNPSARRASKNLVKIKIYEQANKIIEGMQHGVFTKKELAALANTTTDDAHRIFKLLYANGIIEDYKLDKMKLIPRRLKLFDPEMLKHGFVWRKAKDISIGDYVVYPIQSHEEHDIILDLATLLPEYPYTENYVYVSGTCKKDSLFPEIYEYVEAHGLPDFKWRERKAFLSSHKWDAKTFESVQETFRIGRLPERIARYLKINEEIAYAFGLYLAEGYSSTGSLGFALNEKESNLFMRAVHALAPIRHNDSYSFNKISGTHGAYGIIASTSTEKILTRLFGKGADKKCIPDIFYDATDTIILRMLEGYLDGDGCHFVTQNNNYSIQKMAYVSATSCNLKMLLQMRKLLLRFGIIASISYAGKPKKSPVIKYTRQVVHTGKNYHLVVRGQEARELTAILWGIDTLTRDVPPRKQSFIYDGYVCMRVIDKEEVDGISQVYGFEVGEDNSFCTAGVATHNTAVPKGEMRLPGKGYESLNQLHPDQFGGKYGAFDRMKILADIAPFSPEYKMWRDIAKKTVTDPELIDEMSEIRQRVNQQGKQHDFYDYKVVGHGLQYKNVVVSEVLGYGKFRSGNSIFKIAGASVRGNANESMKDVLGRYIHVGQTVTVAVDEDSDNQTNNDSIGSINAAVYIDGQNVGKQMISAGDAAIRKSDNSTPAVLGDMGVVQKGAAYASEFIAHLDLPWISDQFLRVRSPLESYEAEQVYGTPYQTWSHPIETFLRPALERSFHDRSAFTGLIGGAYRISEEIEGLSPGMRHGIGAAYLLSDRGAFIGAALSQLWYLGDSKKAMEWARHGSAISTLGHVLTGGNSYADETLSAANVGQEVAHFFKKSRGKGALIGAAVGALYRTATNPNGEWIPQRTKKKWEMQDYYDRLTYLKFMGLYKKAAEKAKDEEDVDIEDVIERRKEATKQNRLAIKHFQSLKKDLVRSAPESEERDRLTSMLTSRINGLEGEKLVVPGGKWTRTALLYKQAAENTMYGLKEDATWSQIITALPQTDREYFMEFVKERNKDRREEILNKVSPFLNRALKMAWGMKEDKQVDNETYFKKHALPQENWAGWAPQYDLKNSEVQSVVNQGLQLGDFGFYESELDKPEVANAPRIQDIHKQDHNSTTVKNRIEKILKGQGLKNVDISVEAGQSGGATSIKASIKTMLGMKDVQERVNQSLQMQAN